MALDCAVQVDASGTSVVSGERPRSPFVVGSPGMNFVKGAIEDGVFRAPGATVELPRPIRAGATTLGIRCEHLRVDSAGSIRGKLVVDEFLGSHRTIHVDAPFGRLIVREDASAERSVGEALSLALDPKFLNFFDSDSGKRL